MQTIADFIKSNFDDDINKPKPIVGGERSKAYIFESKNKKYIFRKNSHNIGFIKDKIAFESYNTLIPIPNVLKIGQYQKEFYAISDFCKGTTLKDDDELLSGKLIKDLVVTLEKIRTLPLLGKGWGVADTNGNAEFNSWNEWILKNRTVVTRDDGSFYTWNDIKNINFVDQKIIENIFSEIKKLLPYVPNERYLLHGDFGPGNVIIDNDKVTGIIDWNEFGYGDFLYDVAWLGFWTKKSNFVKKYKNFMDEKANTLPFYEERIKCHQLFIGLTALGIYSAIDLENAYTSVLNRIKCIINL